MAEKKKLSDNLRPASFRGVPFQVESTELGAGRRTQLHEYPQRDKPYVEDLGRAARDLAFSGFVVGEDYVDQANALLGALEEPGPGTLIHPWFGTLTVSLKDSARVSFDAALGQARFSMSFVEAGELEFPSSETSTQAASRIAASNLEKAAVESFADRFSIKGFQDFVAAAANGNLGDMLGIVSSSEIGKVLGYANSLANTVSTAIALVSNPSTLGWKIMGAFGLSGLATTVAAWSNIVRSLSRVGSSGKMDAPGAPVVYTPSRQQAYVNACAVNALGRQALIAQAVGASSLVGTTVDSSARPVISHADMVAVRNELIAVIDRESLTASDQVYAALMKARAAVWKDLTTRARESARLTTLTPNEVTPALVLAYDYYEDASRDTDIVARNGIRHPGFVPVLPMKVLTR
ncbi:MAG: DNA circularization N-terminal domain-containing protein [Betaproteobacteria bacterium]|nr:DNA circularization N-terminal domain-containing protein [Betaproteobacteria bacterium]